jgi:hypothetical protein
MCRHDAFRQQNQQARDGKRRQSRHQQHRADGRAGRRCPVDLPNEEQIKETVDG